ncbi:PA3496 family putative envelope integrity protein [Leucothrix pacifica]|uniref:Uncharacterized protein n=1 Tax=Leucothrix pacifica TaxID=1247513 RepID=A0A317CSK2_9GAMM|nr:hypothetical protein [Leucothrix pacifica]PWR00514.1 hypothetical protein DKW60_01450 [Leucothrix pacifica]
MSRNDNVFFLFESNIKREFKNRKKRQSKKMRRRLEVKRKLDNYFENKRINRQLGFLEDDDELMWEI